VKCKTGGPWSRTAQAKSNAYRRGEDREGDKGRQIWLMFLYTYMK
jgi:hypothetical protein